eukprot:scaffold49857_cov71-Cyclotella_meneghiniana.AAC.1
MKHKLCYDGLPKSSPLSNSQSLLRRFTQYLVCSLATITDLLFKQVQHCRAKWKKLKHNGRYNTSQYNHTTASPPGI